MVPERDAGRLTDNRVMRRVSAGYEMVARARLTHVRPPFGIDQVEVAGEPTAVHEEIVVETPFASLLHFAKDTAAPQPQVLLVAALAGHFSTLLRNTVRTLLADHDVYVTDWHNARDVGLEHGRFGLDDYIDHVIAFLEHIGPGAHVMAVCQPCPAVAGGRRAHGRRTTTRPSPGRLTLDGRPGRHPGQPDQGQRAGPLQPLSWFEHNVITTVPARLPRVRCGGSIPGSCRCRRS